MFTKRPDYALGGLVALLFTLAVTGTTRSHTSVNSCTSHMDTVDREAFLASVDAEEEWLDSVSRRLSTGTPQGNRYPDPNPSTPLQDNPGQESSAGPTRRSGRKRKSTSEAADPRRSRMSSQQQTPDKAVLDQLKDLMKEMREVREDVNRSEVSTTGKIDGLARKMTDRMGKTEQSVKALSQDVTSIRRDLVAVRKEAGTEAVRVEKLIEEVVDRKMAAKPDVGRRPRSGLLSGANLTLPRQDAHRREDDYLAARKSLRMWPVAGANLPAAVINFMEEKLLLPSGKFRPGELLVFPVLARADSQMRDQVLVTFPTIQARDEVKNLARNL